MVSGSRNGRHRNRDATTRNSPLLVTRPTKPGPCPSRAVSCERNSTVPSSSGTSARPSSSTWLRRRPSTRRSSERTSRSSEPRRGATVSTSDIEALPGQLDEDLLQVRPSHLEAQQVDARVHERGGHLL